MPVTIYPAPHPSKPCRLAHLLRDASPEQVLRRCTATKLKDGQTDPIAKFSKIWESSFSHEEFVDVFPSANGFVHAAIRAYNAHHHLRIRPDDVWISILSQLSIYVNKNAEALRSIFVSHQGKKALDMEGAIINGFDQFAGKITQVLGKSVKDPSVATWIMQEFSTTTPTDRIAAGIIMMATFQSYFKYFDAANCGLPSVTLLGTRDDWVTLLDAIDRLATFVPEEPSSDPNGPAAQIRTWVSVLRPVLTRFVRSFDHPESEQSIAFWQQIADYRVGGSGADYLSGWLTAFCYWNEMGECTYPLDGRGWLRLKLDEVGYAAVDWDNIPPGWATVPLEIDLDDGQVHKCRMLAGSVGITPFLARVEGAVDKHGRVAETPNGKVALKANTFGTKKNISVDDKKSPRTSSTNQSNGGIGRSIVRKILSCDFSRSLAESANPSNPSKPSKPSESPAKAKEQSQPSPDAYPPVPGQEILLPPYRARPLKEPPILSYSTDPVSDYEGGRYSNLQQSVDNPPPYQLDGLQPRIGWWLWEEEIVEGSAPLPDGLEDYVPAGTSAR